MADNTVNVGINVSDNGTTVNLIKKVKNLKDLLTQTAGIASSINMGGGTGGTGGGSAGGASGGGGGGGGRPRPPAGPAPAPSGGAAGPANPSGGGTYGQARATFGTGAGARDFARQSEGLGGLVRLYATFAANIFAVGAAFRALSTAMDTTNMIAGLDQLGAQSGKSLGAVAKNLVAATGGAISLREAMTATAQASAAGMSSKDIIRMGNAAKNASAILGVDMTDALSRLSRGITKLEPELLDELGIFTKIGPASEEYARKLGKSALALTDFEKRQGFSNAVLAETEAKFGAIKVDVNPYSQLAASLKNVSQSTLEFVNSALGPLVKLLSESPTALIAGITLIGGALLKQAIPALSQFGTKLRETADDAEEKAKDISDTLRNLGPSRAGVGGFDLQRTALERIERQAIRTATSFRVLSNAVDNTKLLGARSAFALLRAEIAATGAALTITQQKVLLFKGTAAIAVTAVGTLTAAFGGAIAKIAGVIAVLGLLGSWFGNNAKQSAAASSSLDTLDDAISNVDRTITAINAKPLLQQLTADSLAARGTAFTELTTGMIDSIKKVEEEITNRNWMDKFTNWVAGAVDKDTETKLANNLSKSFDRAFKIAGSTIDLTEFKTEFAEQLKLDPSASTGVFLAALKSATPEVKALAAVKLDKLSAGFNAVAQRAKDFNAQMMATSKLYDEIALKYQVTDSSAKFGEEQAKGALALNLELQDTDTAISAIIDISQDLNKLRLFDPESAKIIMGLAPQIKAVGEAYRENERLLDIEAQKLAKINALIIEKKALIGDRTKNQARTSNNAIKDLEAEAAPIQAEVTRREGIRKDLQPDIERFSETFAEAARKTFIVGSERISAAILQGFAKAKLIIQEATLSLFPDNKTTILEQAAIAKAQIASDIAKLKSDQSLIDSQEALRLAYEDSQQEKGVAEGTISASTAKNLTEINKFQQDFMASTGAVTQKTIDEFTALSNRISVKGVTQVEMNKLNAAQSLLNRRGGVEGAIRVKQAEAASVDIKTAGKIRAKDSEENIRLIDAAISSIDRSSQVLQQRIGGMTTTEGLTAQQGLASDKRQAELSKAREPALQSIRSAGITGDKKQLEEGFKVLNNLQEQYAATEATARVTDEIALSKAQITETLAKQNMLDEANLQLSETAAQVAKSRSDFSAQQLDYDYSIGKINKDTYDDQKRTNAIKQEEVNLAQTLLQIESKRKKDTAGLSTQLNDYTISGAKRTQLEEEFDLINKVADAEADRARIERGLIVEGIRLGEEMNERITTYAEAFKSTVGSMSDALVDFAMTGKASFGDLIESMILDLIKFEQRRMMTEAFGALGGFSGIASGLVSAFTGGATAAATGSSQYSLSSGSGMTLGTSGSGFKIPAAKGGVFDQGRTNFAMGGAFTNTIVTKPTTFAFAKGAGLMGESGPEAIMPLKRGANGSLGVQGGGTNVDVVVNNYGSEKAETKETIDSRGNRRIEVIIGEQVASEVSRPNSPMQASLRNTYGMAPTLVRR